MKKFLKLFFIGLLFVSTTAISNKALAEYYERSDELIAKDCPDPGRPELISICGSVRQALPEEKVLSDGSTAPRVALVPAENVSVYLYECDNTSPTCKQDGKLVHPFSSTYTNKYGKFHLVARKMDNTFNEDWEHPIEDETANVTYTVQSKKRYLVFKCGSYFQGIHIIPSYKNLTEVIHEVHCDTEDIRYMPVEERLNFTEIGGALSYQMGIYDKEEDYYPDQTGEPGVGSNAGLHTASQIYFDRYKKEISQSVFTYLDGGDPRFTGPGSQEGKSAALRNVDAPRLGAWYSYDCFEKYKDTKWVALCAGYDGNDIDEALRVDYENNLYNEPAFTIQHLLPNIPPTKTLLYYRPLEIRHDISAYYQDHDDIAKFLGMEFSNCVGSIYKRKFGEHLAVLYPNCEKLRQCNETLNDEGYQNTSTTAGPAQSLASPNYQDSLSDIIDPEIPVCVKDGDATPIKIKEIQKVGEVCNPSKHKLCSDGAYWNNYYVFYLGQQNTTKLLGNAIENHEDSFSRPDQEDPDDILGEGQGDCNNTIFAAGQEGDDVPQGGCTAMAFGGGNVNGMNAIDNISSGSEILTDFIAQPFENDNMKMEIASGIPYLISARPRALGEYSSVNDKEEEYIVSGNEDNEFYTNMFFSGEPFETPDTSNFNHYPGEDLKGELEPSPGGQSGPRTPTQGLYLTTPAWNRVKSLESAMTIGDFQGKRFSLNILKKTHSDALDSAISISSGDGKIDWLLTNIRNNLSIWQWIEAIIGFLSGGEEYKTFADRDTSLEGWEPDLIDSLLAKGFEVNEGNFRDLFPCPSLSAITKSGIYPKGAWGDGGGCYPWHKLGDGDTCGTSKEDPTCDGDISRTCRIDECMDGPVDIRYRCLNGNVSYMGADTDYLECTEKLAKECISEQGNIGRTIPEELVYRNPCNPGETYEDTLYDVPIYRCTMSVAGPNECDGDVERNTKIRIEQQLTAKDDSVDKINADEVPEAGLKLYKSFRDPFSENIAPLPAAWVSVASSMSSKESLKKDWVGVGTGTNYLTRAQVGSPNSFGSESELNELKFHCSPFGTGPWQCELETIPNPEILELKDLEDKWDTLGDSCNLNTSESCAQLVLGSSDLKFSRTFEVIMSLAGNTFGVEPAAILAYMERIGTTKKYAYYWSEQGEETLKEVSLPWYGNFNFCDDMEYPAQHPYDWILTWFTRNMYVNSPNRPTPAEAIADLAPGREKTASRCNFLDATYVIASAFSRNIRVDCNDQNWDNVSPAVYLMLFGGDPRGAYGDDNSLSEQKYKDIFDACKN